MNLAIKPAIILSTNPVLATSVARLFAKAVKDRELDGRRMPPDGNEIILWIGDENLPLGFATFYEPANRVGTLWLDILYVVPALRKQGLGFRLLLAVKEEGKKLGHLDLMLGTATHNLTMHRMAKSLGLHTCDVIMKVDLQ